MMERKSGHNQQEVDEILREAERRKAEAEKNPETKVTPEELTKIIEQSGPDILKEDHSLEEGS